MNRLLILLLGYGFILALVISSIINPWAQLSNVHMVNGTETYDVDIYVGGWHINSYFNGWSDTIGINANLCNISSFSFGAGMSTSLIGWTILIFWDEYIRRFPKHIYITPLGLLFFILPLLPFLDVWDTQCLSSVVRQFCTGDLCVPAHPTYTSALMFHLFASGLITFVSILITIAYFSLLSWKRYRYTYNNHNEQLLPFP